MCNIEWKIDEGLSLSINPYAIKEQLSEEDALKFAEGLCWGEVMKVAAARLAGESEDYDGWGDSLHGDQRPRLEFLAAVESQANAELVAEVARLKGDLERKGAECDRMFVALGGGSENIDLHSRACAIRFGPEVAGSVQA